MESWISAVAAQQRTEQPLSDLRIALQGGGSDAFSGVTANPLAGAVAAEVIRHGGAACLAENDERAGLLPVTQIDTWLWVALSPAESTPEAVRRVSSNVSAHRSAIGVPAR